MRSIPAASRVTTAFQSVPLVKAKLRSPSGIEICAGEVPGSLVRINVMTITLTMVISPRIIVVVSTITSQRKNRSRGGSGWSGVEDWVMTGDKPLEIELVLGEAPGGRLDKALARVVPEGVTLSRSRLVALIREGALRTPGGAVVDDPRGKPEPGMRFVLSLPAPEDIEAGPENIALDVIHEDAELIVVNKPVGMVVHPAPGTPSGTLVNALLHHCGDTLSGVGGAKRPGIVHRIDKDTSGILVVAKSDRAHQGLARQFADHSIERLYDAFVWGVPLASDPRLLGLGAARFEAGGVLKITAPIARHAHDRKKMAVVTSGGRHAVTRAALVERFGDMAAHVECQLETGRTHQIRVHMTHVGHPLMGDPVYGRARTIPKTASHKTREMLAGFTRQALHARLLGFVHPVSGQSMSFEAHMPADMVALASVLRAG